MKYIEAFREGERVSGVYLCKLRQPALTKAGKAYENLVFQDKTGMVDAKIWDPNSHGIEEFEALDYVDIVADITSFQGQLQLNVKRARKMQPGEYDPADYLPVTQHDIEKMYAELLGFVAKVENPYLSRLLRDIFIEDSGFIAAFKFSSAAKTVHHAFVGGLLEHTLSVTKLCDYYIHYYPMLNADLLYTAAMCHDIGKIQELSPFPQNDYTDEGQLLGHIMIGAGMVGERIGKIQGFPAQLANELVHCILSHHGELEYGSPKKPALLEAVALNFADNTDAHMQTMIEALKAAGDNNHWLGYNRFFESNIRKTGKFL